MPHTGASFNNKSLLTSPGEVHSASLYSEAAFPPAYRAKPSVKPAQGWEATSLSQPAVILCSGELLHLRATCGNGGWSSAPPGVHRVSSGLTLPLGVGLLHRKRQAYSQTRAVAVKYPKWEPACAPWALLTVLLTIRALHGADPCGLHLLGPQEARSDTLVPPGSWH
ncbi:hypothetical protein NDU88_001993 [Pleurodeles waltl]|uniref:Uncharacterized protein n=1 Tax=Pleurodeles waltl TaxID=8319 RepID=A0AAV7SEA9_PLEWA|nr:hypothetical protein NDU88_001993 [Pleurodeles waltl]